FSFRDFSHVPSDKNLSKNGSVPLKGGSLCVKDAFTKKFFGAGRDSAGGACVPYRLDSEQSQEPAGASAAASACGKLHFAGFGRARRGCMLDMRRRALITLVGGAGVAGHQNKHRPREVNHAAEYLSPRFRQTARGRCSTPCVAIVRPQGNRYAMT